jgi:hypothetical protein
MLAKLLTLLSASKGAAVAAAVVLGAATVTVGASSPEVQDAVQNVVNVVTGNATSDTAKSFKNDCDHGQPAVVAQRNAATKLIDATFQQHQKALEELRGKGVDNKAAGDLIKTADDQLRDVRTKALNDVAGALSFGREGQNKPSGSPSAKPSSSPAPSASACPSSSPEVLESPKPSASPKAEGSAKPSEEGRVTVADRTTLDANIKAIVDKAIADMDAIVKDATTKVGALPSPDRGGGKPSDNPGNKPSGNPSEEHKPSGSPKP